MDDLSLANFVTKDKSMNENFKLKVTPIVDFIIIIQRIFHLRFSANALYDCYMGIVDSFIFIR